MVSLAGQRRDHLCLVSILCAGLSRATLLFVSEGRRGEDNDSELESSTQPTTRNKPPRLGKSKCPSNSRARGRQGQKESTTAWSWTRRSMPSGAGWKCWKRRSQRGSRGLRPTACGLRLAAHRQRGRQTTNKAGSGNHQPQQAGLHRESCRAHIRHNPNPKNNPTESSRTRGSVAQLARACGHIIAGSFWIEAPTGPLMNPSSWASCCPSKISFEVGANQS